MEALARVGRGQPEERRRRLRALSPALIRALQPLVRVSVEKALRRRVGARRAVAQEIEDVVQTVLLRLFAGEGSALAAWDPEHRRALGLEDFVALVSAHEVDGILRSRRKNPWTEEPTEAEDLEGPPVSRAGPESRTGTRRLLFALVGRLHDRLTPLGFTLFDLLLLQDRAPEDVAATVGLTISAVYTWRSRLCRAARDAAAELERGA